MTKAASVTWSSRAAENWGPFILAIHSWEGFAHSYHGGQAGSQCVIVDNVVFTPLIAFYDTHGRIGEVVFYSAATTRPQVISD